MPPAKVRIEGGTLTLGPTDWDSSDIKRRRTLTVSSFLIDSVEVTVNRYQKCVQAGLCSKQEVVQEPGLPLTGLSAAESEAFCAYAGGRLPTESEWMFAAMGPQGRRFPWGSHGLVCRRAVFGLVDGPCAEDGSSPELAGMRPEGATPEGVFDLAGNVAEWTRDEDGSLWIKGGSFRSKRAGELKNISRGLPEKGDDVGLRCVYPLGKQR